ncbi:MAG: class I SAM-dependent methyltransferase [Rhodococcus sp.]|uniref:class I SAM-dependent methyltransferase n=1 Tax=Rhodococcus TaxID=1827 RepID=UPI00169CD402|nr:MULTISPECIES: class I SAM-dependent methyltransferase [Rhodococcus]NLV79574.1 class I SAM-dependent methyltransferase [Rhodococcus sp. (in: high G+C Gram-positive bacteria)]
MTGTNWFADGGKDYARYRPGYPPRLAAFLTSLAPSTAVAVDVGCGNGQLTVQLAGHFDAVVGVDPSADQLAHATPHDRVRYLCAPAERVPVADRSAALITAAQAAHWFDLPAFYAEVRRIATDDAVIALISYGLIELEADLTERFDRFYRDEIGPFWTPERALVESGYAELGFPFDERTIPPMAITARWDLRRLLGYLATWSAVRRAGDAGRADVLREFAADLTALWGDPEVARPVVAPIAGRVGIVRRQSRQ